MKTVLALLFCSVLLASATESFALVFGLDRPDLAIPKDFPAASRTNLLSVLQRPAWKFLGGSAFNSNTNLRYGGDAQALSLFLEALTKCPGITLSIRFYRYDEAEKCDWTVQHSADREPSNNCVRVNLNSMTVNLDDLVLPVAEGPRLPDKPKPADPS